MFYKIHICVLLFVTLLLEVSYAQTLTGNQSNVNFFRENNQEKFHNIVTRPIIKM
jgi:hypothetical protein